MNKNAKLIAGSILAGTCFVIAYLMWSKGSDTYGWVIFAGLICASPIID